MYEFVLLVHSWLRWAVLATGLAAIAKPAASRWFIIMLDVQILLGLLLYFALSPFTKLALSDFGAAMGDSQLRFYAVEHVFGMVIATLLAHVGHARLRRVAPTRARRTALIFFGLALIAILVSIPWPGMPTGRPLFRGITY